MPGKSTKKQQAYERIIAQMMDKTKLGFPGAIKDKEEFLEAVIKRCRKTGFEKKFKCKWGWVKKPIEFLENIKEEEWTIEGVKEFYMFYKSRRATRQKHSKMRVEEWIKPLNLPSKKKVWEIGKEIERELNEYGKKWNIESYLIEIVYWASSGYEIKIGIGPFVEWFRWKGSKEGLTEYLKELVKECLNYPEELEEMWEEIEESQRSSTEFLKKMCDQEE